MSRVLRAADTRELPLIFVLIAAALAEGHWSSDSEGLAPLGVLAAIAIAVPLLWRHRAPQVVLALVVAGVFACMATLKPGWTVVAVSAVAIYSVALYGDRIRTLGTAACVLAVTVAVMTLFSDRGLFSYDALTRLGILLIALVLGDAVRGRRAVVTAAAEREAELEHRRADDAERRLADERLRIAQEVHDVVAHAMVAINVQAGVAAHVLHKRPGQAETALTEIKRVSGAALDDLRATLGLLRDENATAPVTNVLRHADASSAAVRVAIGARSVEIDVRNDSVAPVTDPPPNGAGTGLRGMAERAEALGGRIEAGRLPDGGWQVHAVLPLA